MKIEGEVLCFFAVREEAKPLVRAIHGKPGWRTAVTGIGAKKARAGAFQALAQGRPRLALTCGFAGGLNPTLRRGTVLFAADDQFPFASALRAAGAIPGTFFCADRILVTVEEKAASWRETEADAVEMESAVIRSVCREHGVPSATVRVISDAADEDLPLDFNRLSTPDFELSYLRLAGQLAWQPLKVLELVRFQRGLTEAADRLTAVLLAALD
jgi:nucleoside phosphorylase